MNKYEKAFKDMTFIYSEKACQQLNYILLKELVERATPKKVIKMETITKDFQIGRASCRERV